MKLALFGTSVKTGNLGLEALTLGALHLIHQIEPEAEVLLFDYVWDSDQVTLVGPEGPRVYTRHGCNGSRRFWHSASLMRMRLGAKLAPLRPPAVQDLADCDLVLDVSGGDSFSDLYGVRRLDMVVGMKALALDLGLPLALLPQTYGPFLHAGSQEKASKVTRSASMAWARDPDSHVILRELLGSEYSPERHPLGVDMAFALAPLPLPRFTALLDSQRDAAGPLVGVNVSGLLANSGQAGRDALGINLDYPVMARKVVSGLLAEGAGHVFLVPHVVTPGSAINPESDPHACEALRESLSLDERACCTVVSGSFTAAQIKSFISQLDWFTGTRMHATIAALSTGVPTTALAYSAKFRGVFDLCGSKDQVIDLRTTSLEDCLAGALAGYRQREAQRAILADRLPSLREDCASQMSRILACANNQESTHVCT